MGYQRRPGRTDPCPALRWEEQRGGERQRVTDGILPEERAAAHPQAATAEEEQPKKYKKY